MSSPNDLILDHDYDGIKEYNNPLPRWWVQLFLLTVVWSVGYMPYYALQYGNSPETDYNAEMQAWNELHPPVVLANAQEMLAMVGDLERISQGKQLFATRCAACHLPDGGGLVGPNLTDAYWLHGGQPVQIVKTVYDGIPEKGMIAWKSQMSLDEIYAVSAYIYTELKGKTPATAKAPQGVLEP